MSSCSRIWQSFLEYFTDVLDQSQQRKDNINAMLDAERASLEEFAMMQRQVQFEKNGVRVVGGLGTAASVAMAVAVSNPVGVAACVMAGILLGSGVAEHSESAKQVQQALQEDMERINAPVQCLRFGSLSRCFQQLMD